MDNPSNKSVHSELSLSVKEQKVDPRFAKGETDPLDLAILQTHWWMLGLSILAAILMGIGFALGGQVIWFAGASLCCFAVMLVSWKRSSLLETYFFQEQDKRIFELAKLTERMDKHLEFTQMRLRMLRRIEEALLSGSDLHEIAKIGLSLLYEGLPICHAAIISFDFSSKEAVTLAIAPSEPAFMKAGETFSLMDLECLELLMDGMIYVCNDVRGEEMPEGVLQNLLKRNVRSLLIAPLMVEGELLGEIHLEAYEPKQFRREEVQIAQEMADSVALGFRQARLLLALRTEREELSLRVAKRTEELSRTNAELIRSSQFRSEFLSSMSHELRTPLNPILGMSELMGDGIYGEVNERQHRALKTIEESGRHLLQLINDILDLSKMETGRFDLEIAVLSVKDLVNSCVNSVREEAVAKSIELSVQVDDSIGLFEGDARCLSQLLSNLLNNAVKFTPEGKKVGLDISLGPEKKVVRLTVWDEGPGIKQSDIRRLFEPFVQLDGSLSRSYQGTGLGLALVARLAELHGGSISAMCALGEGCSFTVSLPCKSPHSLFSKTLGSEPILNLDSTDFTEYFSESVDLHPSLIGRHMKSRKVSKVSKRDSSRGLLLVVDNNDTILLSFRWHLMGLGFDVIEARSGEEALVRNREERPCLILMDLQLPVMDGFAAIKALRDPESAAFSDVPMIAFSSLIVPGERELCMKMGCNDYFPKPVPFHKLEELLSPHLP